MAAMWVEKMVDIIDKFKDCAQIAQPARAEGKMISAILERIGGAVATTPSSSNDEPEIIGNDTDED